MTDQKLFSAYTDREERINQEYKLAETVLEKYIARALASSNVQKKANEVLNSAEKSLSFLPSPITEAQRTLYEDLIARLTDRITDTRQEINNMRGENQSD